MKYNYTWLKEYYKTDDSAQKTSDLITELGSEVEPACLNTIDPNVIAVRITSISRHPNADKLQLATVSDGNSEVTVVCGAKNIREGQVVPYARPGAKLNGLEVKEVEIRGVKSPGMLLSERELGISNEHTGIKILNKDVHIGLPVSEVIAQDEIIEAEITPNRGDLLSHFGMARDLSAKAGRRLNKPNLEIEEEGSNSNKEIRIEVKSEECSLYIARVIKGVKIGPSPQWLKDRLISCGVNSVNNVVDITNYIMLDLGHPLHAFDAKKILGGQIVVSEIDRECEVMCLDNKARALIPGMLCINDSKRPIAIAGVMGLKCSEIDEDTTDVILEAAVFNPKSVRKTAKLLGVRTEASYRFERGVDDRGTSYAIKKAAKMIVEVAGGKILSGEVVAGKVKKQSNVRVEYKKISNLIGHNYSKEQINKILESLGFEVNEDYAYIPSWRHDINIWQDLVEEVARLGGLDKIVPAYLPAKEVPKSGDYYKKEKIKDILVQMGLDEAITYTFLSEKDIQAAKIGTGNLIEVANPIQIENRYLRNSLVPGLLKVIAKSPSFDDIEIFELGRIFDNNSERESLAIVSCGKSARTVDKIVKKFSDQIGINYDMFKVYKIDRDELKRFKIKKPVVYVAEAEVSKVLNKAKLPNLDIKDKFEAVKYRPISKYPPVSRDIAFILSRNHSLESIKEVIFYSSEAVVLAEPFDEFIDDRFGKDKKSVAFHIYLQDMDKTMSDQDAERELSKVIKTLRNKFQAEIRS